MNSFRTQKYNYSFNDYYRSPIIGFSDCGIRVHLGIFCMGYLQMEPRPTRRMLDYEDLTYRDESYRMEYLNNEVRIRFSRTRWSVPSGNDDYKHVTSEPLTSYPANLNFCDKAILLGSTNQDLMRIALVSDGRLEMKTLLWTFAEVRSRLIEKWGQANKLKEGEAFPDKDVVLADDKPNISSSADQSPSDLITWFPGYSMSPLPDDSPEDPITENHV